MKRWSWVYLKSFTLLLIVASITFLTASYSFGDIIIFNDNVLGGNIESEITLTSAVEKQNFNSVQPIRIAVAIKNGKYVSAEISYLVSDIKMTDVQEILNQIYKGSRYKVVESDKFKVWRINDKKITITLSENEPCIGESEDRVLSVTYSIWN